MGTLTAHEQLATGLQALGVSVDIGQQKKLLDFAELLARWGKVHNLTAIHRPQQVVTKHLLDALSVVSSLSGQTVLDVGTGAGLPGLPLAIVEPQRRFTLLDARQKRIAFVRHAAQTLTLTNVEVVESRVEDYQSPIKFDTLVARAVTDLASLVEMSHRHCHAGSRILAMKGRQAGKELALLDSDRAQVLQILQLTVPGLAEQRQLIVLRPVF